MATLPSIQSLGALARTHCMGRLPRVKPHNGLPGRHGHGVFPVFCWKATSREQLSRGSIVQTRLARNRWTRQTRGVLRLSCPLTAPRRVHKVPQGYPSESFPSCGLHRAGFHACPVNRWGTGFILDDPCPLVRACANTILQLKQAAAELVLHFGSPCVSRSSSYRLGSRVSGDSQPHSIPLRSLSLKSRILIQTPLLRTTNPPSSTVSSVANFHRTPTSPGGRPIHSIIVHLTHFWIRTGPYDVRTHTPCLGWFALASRTASIPAKAPSGLCPRCLPDASTLRYSPQHHHPHPGGTICF